MTNDGTITNRMLLEHIQGSKYELSQKIDVLSERVERLEVKVDRGFVQIDRRFADVYHKLDEARLHRETLQEDLEATIKMQSAHQKKIATLSGKGVGED